MLPPTRYGISAFRSRAVAVANDMKPWPLAAASIRRRLSHRPRRRGSVRAAARITAGLPDDCPRLRFREPLHRYGVRVDLVPDVECTDAIVLGDADRHGTRCDEIIDGSFRVLRSRRARMADFDIRHRHG